MVEARSRAARSKGWREARWFAAGLLLAQLAVGAPALAQGSSAPATKPQAAPGSAGQAVPAAAADPDQEVVKLYNQGVEAVKAKQWEKAREPLLKAFKLKPLAQIAANLGYAEFMLFRYRDAAEHLSFYLREAKDISATDRQDMEKKLAAAKAKIGTVTVRVNVEGASVLVDAHKVGESPLSEPVLVEPGTRVFEAQKDGLTTGRQAVDVAAGSASVVVLSLAPAAPPTQGGALPPQGGTGRPGGTPPVETAWPPWRIGAVAGGGGLAAVGIGLGIGFSVASASKNRAAIEETIALVIRTEKGNLICPQGDGEPRCQKLTQFAHARDTYHGVAITSFVIGGVAAAGAVVAALWPYIRPAQKARPASSLMILPSPQGAVVTGSF